MVLTVYAFVIFICSQICLYWARGGGLSDQKTQVTGEPKSPGQILGHFCIELYSTASDLPAHYYIATPALSSLNGHSPLKSMGRLCRGWKNEATSIY